MQIDEMREKIVNSLSSAELTNDWYEILNDTSPGHYGVEDVCVELVFKDIFVEIPNKTFTFKNLNLSFSARLGGSSDKNGFDENFTLLLSGDGVFKFITGTDDLEVVSFKVNENLDLYAPK